MNPEIRAALSGVAVPTVVSALWRMGFRNTMLKGLRPANPAAAKFVGPARTVRTIATREDLVAAQAAGERPNLQGRIANEIAAGEVLVVAMAGETGTAFMGDIMATAFHVRGVAGVVLDGGLSDLAACADIALPLHVAGAAGLPVNSHRFVIDLDCPVDCAGVAVLPGDVVMGDLNGVVAIPAAKVEEVAKVCVERELLESWVIERVRGGAPLAGTYPPDEATLAAFAAWRRETGR